MRILSLLALLLLPLPALAQPPKASPGNRLAYLDELDPYYPHAKFPKLITPQWVGEEGVDAVVILAIDDMRDPKKYETFLRPILNRLKKIDGRAPVSIMTCSVKPEDPQLQSWLKEGLSLEVHTVDHPCPYFKPGFDKAKDTTDRGVDLMHAIPGNKPVAFRMPCCDSMNTPSPRHWAEIFNKTSFAVPPAKQPAPKKKRSDDAFDPTPRDGVNFLTIDSSVFMVYTSDDPELPKELVLEDGKERFKKYLPMDREFVNWIENYPYPYLIGRSCWQFPCMTPSDWEAQHLHKSNNPLTLRDWKDALDCTVIKKGVFTMVFHPHGWIKAEQIIELIDHAVETHGKKVKFLTFKEANDRLVANLQGGHLLRQFTRFSKDEGDNGIRLVDVNNDGYLDVIIANTERRQTRVWLPKSSSWKLLDFPTYLDVGLNRSRVAGDPADWRFGIHTPDGLPTIYARRQEYNVGGEWRFNGEKWIAQKNFDALEKQEKERLFQKLLAMKPAEIEVAYRQGKDDGVRFLDLDGDGICELILGVSYQNSIHRWSAADKKWKPLPFSLPAGAHVVNIQHNPGAVRFLDLNGDGKLDLVFSNEKEYGVYLFVDMQTGWKKLRSGKAGDANSIPPITKNGKNNGCWAHSGHLWWANEDTVLLKNNVDRRSFKELLEQK